MSPCWSDPLPLPSDFLSLLALKSTLSHHNITTPAFLSLIIPDICFYLFLLNLLKSLHLKYVSCRQHIVVSWFLAHNVNLILQCFSIGAFGPFTSNVPINMHGLSLPFCYLLSVNILFSFLLFLYFVFLWVTWKVFNSTLIYL